MKSWMAALLCAMLLMVSLPVYGETSSQITPADVLEDLDFLETTIRQVHPDPFQYAGVDRFVRHFVDARRSVEEAMSREELYYLTQGLAGLVEDQQTRLYLDREDRELAVRFWWAEEGLVMAGAAAKTDVKPGWLVASIGGQSVDQILEQAKTMLIAENDYGLQTTMAKHLHSGAFLNRLGVLEGTKVTLELQDEQEQTVTVDIELRVPRTVAGLVPQRPQWGWWIADESNTAVFYIDSFIMDDDLQWELQRFFRAVSEEALEKVVFDLRFNTGGNFDVVKELLRYLPERRIQGYAAEIRYSKQAAAQKDYDETAGVERVSHLTRLFGGYLMEIPPSPEDIPPFEGSVYVMTSSKTVGAAHWFAVIVQDNQIGYIAGEPTGNRPTGYSGPLEFELPNSQLRLAVSHKRWIRPDPDRDPSDSLYPDISIPITADDVRADEDVHLQRLLETIRQ